MYMKMRRGHSRDDSVMKKPEKRNDANLPAGPRAWFCAQVRGQEGSRNEDNDTGNCHKLQPTEVLRNRLALSHACPSVSLCAHQAHTDMYMRIHTKSKSNEAHKTLFFADDGRGRAPGADEEEHAEEGVAEEGGEGLRHALEGPERHAVDEHLPVRDARGGGQSAANDTSLPQQGTQPAPEVHPHTRLVSAWVRAGACVGRVPPCRTGARRNWPRRRLRLPAPPARAGP